MNEHPEIIFPPTVGTINRAPTDEKPLEQLTDEEFWHRAHERAHRGLVDVQPEHSREYLVCSCHSGRFLVPLTALYEVVLPPLQFTLLPGSPRWMLGLTAWRGETIAVIDLDAYLSADAPSQLAEATTSLPLSVSGSLNEGCLLIGTYSNIPVGLLVQACLLPISIQSEDVSLSSMPAVKGMYGDALVLDGAVLLADVMQQIGMAGRLS